MQLLKFYGTVRSLNKYNFFPHYCCLLSTTFWRVWMLLLLRESTYVSLLHRSYTDLVPLTSPITHHRFTGKAKAKEKNGGTTKAKEEQREGPLQRKRTHKEASKSRDHDLLTSTLLAPTLHRGVSY